MSDEIVITRTNINKEPSAPTPFPTEIVDLPSEGKFYSSDNPLSKGNIELKYMTAKEEDILTSQNLLKRGIAIDKLLESLIVDKSIDLNTMLVGDKNALIFAVRRLAYGDSYGPLEVNCTKCNEKNSITIDLGKLLNKEINSEGVLNENGEYTFVLPVTKHTLTFKLLSSADEKNIEDEIKSMAKLKKNSSSGELITRLKHTITSINGDRNKDVIRKFVENDFLSKDSLSFRQFVRSVTPDLDTVTNYYCSSCDSEERVAVPITVQFFWPDTAV